MKLQSICREKKRFDAFEIKTERRPESQDKQPSPSI
jgi:hypothetical protein